MLFICISFSKATEKELTANELTSAGMYMTSQEQEMVKTICNEVENYCKEKNISDAEGKMIFLQQLAEKKPLIAKRIIESNRLLLSDFENYCVGIPADKDLTLEDTLYLEHRRLLSEAYYLEQFLNKKSD